MTVRNDFTNDLIEEINSLRARLKEAEDALTVLQGNGAIEIPVKEGSSILASSSPSAESLFDSEYRFRTMADGTPVMIWVDDGAGGLEFINRAYCDFFGVTLQDVQVEGWHPLVHPDDTYQYVREFMKCTRERRPFRAQARVRRHDGEWRWIDSQAQPRFSDSGEFLGMVGSSLDITETKLAEQALQESETRFRQLADAMPHLVWTAFPDGKVDYYNQRRVEYSGLSLDTNGNWEWEMILHPDDLEQTWIDWKNSNEAGETYESKHRIRMADGSYRWHLSRALPVKDGHGKVMRWFGTATDIHDTIQAADQLKASEIRFRQLADAMPQLVWTAKPDGTRDYYNHRVHEYRGYQMKEDGSWDWSPALHPDDFEHTMDDWTHSIKSGEAYESEHRLRMADGSLRWHLSRGVPTRDEHGQIIRWYGTGTDIHDRKMAEEELRESELRLRIAKDAARFGIYDLDLQSNQVRCDERMRELWGIPTETPVTLEVLTSAIHPQDYPRLLNTLRQTFDPNHESNFSAEYRLTNLVDGLERWISTTGMVLYEDSQAVRVIGAVRDITERKQAEQALQDSENKFSTIFEYAPFAISLSAMQADEFVFLDVNHVFLKTLEFEKDDVIGKTSAGLGLHSDGFERQQMIAELISKGHLRNIELFYQTKSGKQLTLSVNVDIVTMSGKLFAISTLEDSENKFSTIFEYAPFAIALAGLEESEFVFLDVNQAFLKLLEFEKDEVIGKTTVELGLIADGSERQHLRDELISGGDLRSIEIFYETKSGQQLILSANVDIVLMSGKSFAISTLENISDRKKNEEAIRVYNEQLSRSNQELQDFAYIASHDLQEPLRKIVAFSDMIGQKSNLEVTEQDYLRRVQSSARRMQKMVDDLLELSRVSTRQKPFTWVNLNQIAGTIVDDMEARLSQVQGQVILHPLPVIEADASQMQQLIQNLLSNAVKFQHPGIHPVVEIGYRDHSTGKVEVYFKDNGIGFDMAHAREIFQPFKRLHGRNEYEGSGIGLAICQRIAEQHRGHIQVVSTPGEGSTFSVVLPTRHPRRK